MGDKDRLSKTMRIDLIPDVPATPQSARVVVTSPSRTSSPSASETRADARSEYERLMDSIYDAAVVCDAEGKIVSVNTRAVEFFLYGRDEMSGMFFYDVISGADASLVRTVNDNLQKERFTLIQAYCVRRNGTYFPAEIAVNKLEMEVPRLCFFVRDTTLRRQTEEMLRTEHNAIQNAVNGIAVADIEARLEYVNPAVLRTWGYVKTDELLGHDVRELLGDTGAASQMIGQVMANRTTWTGEMKGLRRNGEPFALQVSAVCNRNSDGDTVGIVFSFVDITDRKRAEEATKETERQRVMLESLATACHHLGQPATVLLANMDIVSRKINTQDPQIKALMDSSVQATQSLAEILHKLNTVNQYRTTPYLAPTETKAANPCILDI